MKMKMWEAWKNGYKYTIEHTLYGYILRGYKPGELVFNNLTATFGFQCEKDPYLAKTFPTFVDATQWVSIPAFDWILLGESNG